MSPRSRLTVAAACVLVLLSWWFVRTRPVRTVSFTEVAQSPVSGPEPRTDVASPLTGAAESFEGERAREAKLLTDVAALSAEFDRLRAQPDDIERLRRTADIENEFTAMLDPETAALLIRRMPAGFADTHFGAIALAKWAAAGRIEAAEWMAAHPAASATAGEALARGWFAADRSGLEAHLDQLPPGPWKTRLAITAGEDAFLAHDPSGVIGLLSRADASAGSRLQLLEWNATAWAKRDVEAASTWAAREPEPARRAVLFAAVAIGQANTDPAAASERLLRTVSAPEALNPAIRAVVRIWALRDPETAASWVAGLPDDSPEKKEAEESLLAVAAR